MHFCSETSIYGPFGLSMILLTKPSIWLQLFYTLIIKRVQQSHRIFFLFCLNVFSILVSSWRPGAHAVRGVEREWGSGELSARSSWSSQRPWPHFQTRWIKKQENKSGLTVIGAGVQKINDSWTQQVLLNYELKACFSLPLFFLFSSSIESWCEQECPGVKPAETEICVERPSCSGAPGGPEAMMADSGTRRETLTLVHEPETMALLRDEARETEDTEEPGYTWKIAGFTTCTASCLGGLQVWSHVS